MEFKVKERSHPNLPKYPTDDFTLAKSFADKIHKEIKDMCKSIVLFGSAARAESVHPHDIDVTIIIDDLTKILSPEVIEAYRIITENCAADISKRLHIQTMKLTHFWDYVRNGDPVIINMLRDGVPLYDIGVFEPVQQLLYSGRIKPSKEAIWTYIARAPVTMQNADWHVMQATLDLYWAVIDAAHAALMQEGETPPTPAHVSDLIMSKLVKPGKVSAKMAKTMDFFYELSKNITHRKIQRIEGKEYDKYRELADEFVKTMRDCVKKTVTKQ